MDLKSAALFLMYLLVKLGIDTVFCDNNVRDVSYTYSKNKDSDIEVMLQNYSQTQNELMLHILKLTTELQKRNTNSALLEKRTFNSTTISIHNCALIRENGIQRVQLDKTSRPFEVLCDQETNGDGWTVVQQRYDGSIAFHNRTMNEFIYGFGSLNGEFFLGLEKLYALTNSRKHTMLIIFKDLKDQIQEIKYPDFRICDESEAYSADFKFFYEKSFESGQIFSLDSDWNDHSCNINGKFPFMKQWQPIDDTSYMSVWFKKSCLQIKSLKMLIRPVNRYINWINVKK